MLRCYPLLVRMGRLGLAAAAFIAAAAQSATALPYRFRIIAEPGDVIEGRTILHFSNEDNPIAINNHREVVFMAAVDRLYNYSIMTPERFIAGAGKVVDGVVPYFADEDHLLSINDAGQVAYRGLLETVPGANPSGRGAIFVNEEIIATYGTVIDGRTITGVEFRPAINNEGTVAFVGWYEGHEGKAAFTQHELVAEAGQVLDDGRIMANNIFGVQIHDSGRIAFTSGFVGQNNAAIFTQEGLLVEAAENVLPDGPFVVNDVVDGRVIAGDVRSVGIAENSEVAFSAIIASPDGAVVGRGLFTQKRLLVEDGDLVNEQTILGLRFGFQFRNSGIYSFLADIPGGKGLFVRENFVIGTGQLVDDRIVADFHPILGMNDRGDLAFLAYFDDGSSAIVLATVPEPSTLLLAVMPMGLGLMLGLHYRRKGFRGKQATGDVHGDVRSTAKERRNCHAKFKQEMVECQTFP